MLRFGFLTILLKIPDLRIVLRIGNGKGKELS